MFFIGDSKDPFFISGLDWISALVACRWGFLPGRVIEARWCLHFSFLWEWLVLCCACIIGLVIHDGRGEGSIAKVYITHQWRSLCPAVWAGRVMLIITTNKLNAIPPNNLSVQ